MSTNDGGPAFPRQYSVAQQEAEDMEVSEETRHAFLQGRRQMIKAAAERMMEMKAEKLAQAREARPRQPVAVDDPDLAELAFLPLTVGGAE